MPGLHIQKFIRSRIFLSSGSIQLRKKENMGIYNGRYPGDVH
jgi:hypothetical protein